MKIIQLITSGREMYGAQQHVLDISRALHKDKHEVIVVMGKRGVLSDRLEAERITVIEERSLIRQINPFKDYTCYKCLLQLISTLKPDVVASHSSKAGVLGRLICSQLNIPNTFTAHGWSFEQGVPFVRRSLSLMIERIVGRYTNKVIVVSEDGKRQAINQKIVKPTQIEKIYYGIKINKSTIFLEKETPILNLVMVARFSRQKDHKTLLLALAQLAHLNWKLRLLGSGAGMTKMKKLVSDLGMDHKIHFEGAVSNVQDYLVQSDIMILTSYWEGLPISILEGMSHGLPVIASDVSGVREAVISGKTGILVNPGDINGVKEAIYTLYDDDTLRINFGQNAINHFKENFEFSRMYQKTLALYEELSVNKDLVVKH